MAFDSPQKISFNNNEKLFLCGDSSKESWNDIPPAQVEFTLRNFLKQRAYYTPEFRYEQETLYVKPGPLKAITSLEFSGQPPEFDEIKLRDIVGQPLTSGELDQIQNFALSRLKNLGYACPGVTLRASVEDGSVHVDIAAGTKSFFLEPKLADPIGLYPKALERFNAFTLDSSFRYEWVQLSSQRAENDGIVVSSQFNYSCPNKVDTLPEPQGIVLNQIVLGGDRHIVTIGAGASTEEFPIVEASLKSVRLNENGANLTIASHVSQRIQKVNTVFTDYIFKNAPRFDFAPNITIDHDNEITYNSSTFQIAAPLEYRGDQSSFSWLTSFGPSAQRIFSNQDGQNFNYSLFSLIAHLTFTSHDYELYSSDPRTGFVHDLNVEMLNEGASVDGLAMVYRLTGSQLFMLNPVDPPQWILGFRYSLAVTESAERAQTTTRMPAQYFNTLGGDQSLRGFGRDELNLGTLGAMTALYFGTEVRYAKSLLLGLEPFAFFDVGALGGTPFEIDPGLYYSPGIGVRVATPFGSIRGTVAHGYVTADIPDRDDREHIQIFFSFGKEF